RAPSIATSARLGGAPVPSTTIPPLITRSCAMNRLSTSGVDLPVREFFQEGAGSSPRCRAVADGARGGPEVGGAGLEQSIDLRGDAGLVADDRRFCRAAHAAPLQDALV